MTNAKPRSTYRHGDLRCALIDAGVELARDGGPDAVVLREATRRAGVVPNAVYRHFESRDELLSAIRSTALSSVRRRWKSNSRRARKNVGARTRRTRDCAPSARVICALLRRKRGPVSHGVRSTPAEWLEHEYAYGKGPGVLDAERRPDAEFLAWSAVHGFARLLIEGPLQAMSHARIEPLAQRLLDMVEQGL